MDTARECVRKALDFARVDRIPIENPLGGEAQERYPTDVAGPRYSFGRGRSRDRDALTRRYTDVWGCVWEAAEDGVCGEVVESPFREGWSGLDHFQPPWEVLREADLTHVNEDCARLGKFIIPMWNGGVNLFERMQHLRGTENLLLDLACLDAEVSRLRDMVHDYFLRQLRLWMDTDVDAIHLHDDWGTQHSLLIAPALWRVFFKPLYKDYCDLAHCHGKYVVMHSDGFILDILPDLIEIGVDAINSQLFCMPIELLAERFGGKICFWGEIDRQYLLTRGSTEEIRQAVRRIAKAFLSEKKTGVVGQLFWGKDHKYENMLAAFDEWSKV